ncbi:MAG: AAA family ATPase [Methanothrix sp.]
MPADPVAKWAEFLRSRYWDELLKLADSYPDERSLKIRFSDIDRFDPEFAEELLENPEQILEAAHAALLELDLPMDVYMDRAHVRIAELPRHFKTRELRSDHIGKLLAIDGLVRTATEVRPKIISAAFQCQRCGFTFFKEQSGNKFEDQSLKCMNQACDRGGPFKLLLAQSKFVDAQKIRVQESPEDLRGGAQPQTLDVELEDDLAGRIFPGDRVIVNGILKSYQRSSPQQGKSTYFDLVHKGISVEMTEQEFEEIEIDPEEEKLIMELSCDPEIYEKIRGSIAPSIYGYDDVKEALALQLVSGFEKHLPDGARIRGDIHILLVGDPGIAKSQLLRYMIKISPRGIYTSGKSSTSAGLTATAVKDELGDGRWTIEAGALVLADKGIAAIDEMDKMDNDDKSALHEAMEQQSYHPLTEIQLADGRKVQIGEFVDRMMAARPLEIIPGKDCEILPIHGDIKIKSTDMSHIFDLPVDRVSRHQAPDNFISINYSNGKEILVTPEHPVYISKDGIACIPASQIKAGDIVPALKSNSGIAEEIGCLKVVDVRVVANQGEHFTDFVYDVTVEPTHTFISQGLVLHNTISVAKAGVMATLKSRCSLLAAANPKLGRFDKYEPIAPQINLTPALMSRFDLIFVLTDDPDTKRDSAIAQHILKSNYAGELATQAAWNQDISQEDIDNALIVIKPVLDPELLRKYVAYARKNIFPTLSDEAKEYFLKYYVGLRSQGQDTNKPVPVTARQLEALIRLGEASARLRLSDKVTLDDAKRVVKILEACLRKVGVDPETGFLDADIIASGTTKSTRDRTKSVIDIIRDVSKEQQGPAPRDAVLDRAVELGIERAKAEEIIDRMRRDGDVFEPRPGMLKLP